MGILPGLGEQHGQPFHWADGDQHHGELSRLTQTSARDNPLPVSVSVWGPPGEPNGSVVSWVSGVTSFLCLLHIGLNRPGFQEQCVC